MTASGEVTTRTWPAPPEDWADTQATVHLWTQVLGKIRLARMPAANHWWNSTLYVTTRGLGTSLMPYPDGRSFSMELDLVSSQLVVADTTGAQRTRPLRAEPVADFYDGVISLLADMDLSTDIWTTPVEIPEAVPLDLDRAHDSYDAEQARRFWLTLVAAQRPLEVFRSRWLGKVSPVHFFWGAMDLAVTRFSGRDAPPYPGSAPNCGPHVMQEAYSHEVSSCGFWPASDGRGAFYSYAYPEPAGFRQATGLPPEASYDEKLGEYLLPYESVRAADDPDQLVLQFLEATYVAAADAADWDRTALERHGGR